MTPESHYARTPDGVEIAYQRFGHGARDIVWIPHLLINIDLLWDSEPIARWLRELGALGRVIVRDMRGTGLSDRSVEPGDIATDVADLMVVMDREGVERSVVIGNLRGAAVASFLAAAHPDRVSELVLWHPQVCGSWSPAYPWGLTGEEHDASLRSLESRWGTPEAGERMSAGEGPVGSVDLSFQRWMTRMMRSGLNPARARSLAVRMFETDVRPLLPSIQASTLVLAREGAVVDEARWIASQIQGATLAILPGDDLMPWFGDLSGAVAEIGRFLGVDHAQPTRSRFLSTLLFTDIVGSTERASDLGDSAWEEIRATHHRIVRERLARHGGREQDTAGDGFFAAFDSPAEAVRCGISIVDAVRAIGLDVRAGVHTGECQLADGKVGGLAVSIGARVAGLARPSQILVSSTVKDLVAGSGLVFEDAGEHELKGVPDRWRLYRVVG